ncbi:hypothetical protein [Streptomyces sp. NPDC057302]|uniref:hypothetical protein n=1 Tax=Streptomyces sp. NPDC057302 TaxID=3346094 RepID=UPI003624BA2F
MNEMVTAITGAVVGALFAGILAAIKAALVSRAGINESLRSLRLSSYPDIWRETSYISRWPRRELTARELARFHSVLQQWYYQRGGLYLSHSARDRYNEVQKVLETWLQGRNPDAADASVPPPVYDALVDVGHALRTALTEDLETRRARSLIHALGRARRHRGQARRARSSMATLEKEMRAATRAD